MGGARASIHCFGKLPIAGDFIHYKIDSDEARAFSEWMQKGHGLVEGVVRSRGAMVTPPPGQVAPRRYGFAWDNGAGRRVVVGHLRESHDKGGLRRFPFALYATIDAGSLRDRPALVPYVFRQVWDLFEAEMATLPRSASVDAMFQRIAGYALEIPEPGRPVSENLDRLLAGTRAGDFWTRVLPGAGRDRRVVVMGLMMQALGAHRGAKAQDIPVTLKLPVGGSMDEVALQTAFWLDLLGGLLRNPRQIPNVFLDTSVEGAPPRSLQIYFRRPDEQSFGCLMTRSYEQEYVDDLTASYNIAPSQLPLAEPLRRLLEKDDASLMDLVRQRWL